jgi:hypothetical protein
VCIFSRAFKPGHYKYGVHALNSIQYPTGFSSDDTSAALCFFLLSIYTDRVLQQLVYTPILTKDIAAVEVFKVFIKFFFFGKFFENFLRRRSNDGFGSDWTVLSTLNVLHDNLSVTIAPNGFGHNIQKGIENFSLNSNSTFVFRNQSTAKINIMCGGGPKLDPTGLY